MSVNTYAKIIQKRDGFTISVHDADTGVKLDFKICDSFKKAIQIFNIWNAQGLIEYGLQRIKIK